jgi:hypothetical protein
MFQRCRAEKCAILQNDHALRERQDYPDNVRIVLLHHLRAIYSTAPRAQYYRRPKEVPRVQLFIALSGG